MMTRFARASGSKASNRKVPEESTPWYVMKQEMHKRTENKQSEDETENSNEETDWKSVIEKEKKVEENKNSVWCQFEDEIPKPKNKGKLPLSFGKTNSNLMKVDENISRSDTGNEQKRQSDVDNEEPITKSKKRLIENVSIKKRKHNFFVEDPSEIIIDASSKHITSKISKKKKRKSEFVCSEGPPSFNKLSCIEDSSSKVTHEDKRTKLHKNKLKSKRVQLNDNNIDENQITDCVKLETDTLNEQREKLETSVDTFLTSANRKEVNYKGTTNSNKQTHHNKGRTVTGQEWKNEQKNSKPFNRRKLDKGDLKLDVNGQEIWVTKLDGFYIRKEDAERIIQLEKDLLKRGVSKEEVRAVVKKERRNAEKSLARQKKKVCFHCRKGGHNLSSCPKLTENGAQIIGSGICYKCGSTEHTHFKCKVSSGQSFRFATCFICKQEGHISRECPDNPRGLYPEGGACKLCGDVTHFKKDCPTLQTKSSKITVGLIDRNIETLCDDTEKNASKPVTKRQNKIINFS